MLYVFLFFEASIIVIVLFVVAFVCRGCETVSFFVNKRDQTISTINNRKEGINLV